MPKCHVRCLAFFEEHSASPYSHVLMGYPVGQYSIYIRSQIKEQLSACTRTIHNDPIRRVFTSVVGSQMLLAIFYVTAEQAARIAFWFCVLRGNHTLAFDFINWVSMWRTLWKFSHPDKFINIICILYKGIVVRVIDWGKKYQTLLLWLTLTQPHTCSITVDYLLSTVLCNFLQRFWVRHEQTVPQARNAQMCSLPIAKCWGTLFKYCDMPGTVPLWLIIGIKHSY